jgi:hypothetical protein
MFVAIVAPRRGYKRDRADGSLVKKVGFASIVSDDHERLSAPSSSL